eukprot:6451704-Amphidinium_carterae.1
MAPPFDPLSSDPDFRRIDDPQSEECRKGSAQDLGFMISAPKRCPSTFVRPLEAYGYQVQACGSTQCSFATLQAPWEARAALVSVHFLCAASSHCQHCCQGRPMQGLSTPPQDLHLSERDNSTKLSSAILCFFHFLYSGGCGFI